MNKEQSLQLFEEGNRAWNAWADERLAERKALEESGDWIDGGPGKWNEQTRSWHEMAKADFSGHRFETEARFDHFRFPGDAVFERVSFLESARFDRSEFLGKAEFSEVKITGFCGFAGATFRATALFEEAAFMGDVSFPGVNFSKDTRFNRARVRGEAHFNGTQFKGNASFEWAAFSGRTAFLDAEFFDKADFRDATFSRRVVFGGATFSDAVTFEQSSFEGPAYFGGSSFAQSAEFKAIRVKGLFSLHNVAFSRVPDFSETHFEEAPRFDNVDLKPARFRKITARKSDTDPSRRWRALRRLAIQGQDHERELQFLKGEMTARRGTQDKLFHLRFWVGWLYQIMSDFGRSMVRPLLWLGIGFVAFTGIYASQNQAVWQRPFAASVACTAGLGDIRVAALELSVHNTVPFARIGASPQIERIYACLYGIQTDVPSIPGQLPTGFSPAVPYGIAIAGVVQFLVSAALIFLFMLAIRNHFRIK